MALPDPGLCCLSFADGANHCNLRQGAPKTRQKALYVGFSQISRPLQVVCFGWSQFPVPEARRAG